MSKSFCKYNSYCYIYKMEMILKIGDNTYLLERAALSEFVMVAPKLPDFDCRPLTPTAAAIFDDPKSECTRIYRCVTINGTYYAPKLLNTT